MFSAKIETFGAFVVGINAAKRAVMDRLERIGNPVEGWEEQHENQHSHDEGEYEPNHKPLNVFDRCNHLRFTFDFVMRGVIAGQ